MKVPLKKFHLSYFLSMVVRMQSRELIANNEVRPNIKEFTETSTILDKK